MLNECAVIMFRLFDLFSFIEHFVFPYVKQLVDSLNLESHLVLLG